MYFFKYQVKWCQVANMNQTLNMTQPLTTAKLFVLG